MSANPSQNAPRSPRGEAARALSGHPDASSDNGESAESRQAQKCITGGPESGSRALLHVAADVAHKNPHRFWKKVTKLNGDNACWVWTSARNYGGYGQFWVKPLRRSVLAHRAERMLRIFESGASPLPHQRNP